MAYGSRGFPWTSDICHREVNIRGICPVAEELHESGYLGFARCLHDLSDQGVDLILMAFTKVWNGRESLR